MEYINTKITRTFEKYFNNYLKEDIEKLFRHAHELTFKKNKVLEPTEHEDDIFIVLSGMMRSFYIDKNGNDMTHIFFESETFFRTEKLFMDTEIYLYHEALSDVETFYIHKDKVKNFIQSNPIYEKQYMKALEESLKYKIYREQSLLLMNATERYQEFQKNFSAFDKIIQQNHIASYIGITPESLSRIKRNLREEIK